MQVEFNLTCILTALAILVGAIGVVIIFWGEGISDVFIVNAGYGLIILALIVFIVGMVNEIRKKHAKA